MTNIASRGATMAVDWEQRIDFDRLRSDRMQRAQAALLDAVLAGWSLEDTKVAILQDWLKGRKGEGEEMSGLVVREQERMGKDAPVNRMLVELSRRIESGELDPGIENAELMVSAVHPA